MILTRNVRQKYEISQELLDPDGRVDTSGFLAAREVSHRVNARRDTITAPENLVRAGELYALTLIDSLYREILNRTLGTGAELTLAAHTQRLESEAGRGSGDELARRLADDFPPVAATHTRRQELADLLRLHLANENPAAAAIGELIDDSKLRTLPGYKSALKLADELLIPPAEAAGESVAQMLSRPFTLHPDSLWDQLTFIRQHWGPLLPDHLGELLKALDLLKEDAPPFFGGGPGPQHPYRFSEGDVEGFSLDQAWMPLTVMAARNVLVWLGQLSTRYGRNLRLLSDIPNEELAALAGQGFTALWLIGIWRRSEASGRIKQLSGDPDAAPSAYSLSGYEISRELGGEEALQRLRISAGKYGIRLAGDMVPNHTGIDADWIYEHPEFYLQTSVAPYPAYNFTGENLSAREGFETYLEDHYYDRSDAAVVFKQVETHSGTVRYIYHGNDGTHLPWNDTAQLDYLNPAVREAVIATIIDVARQFPIIRFDAAMTLAREHIQRLWYPEPGKGGAVASRSEQSMDPDEFRRRLPKEFWREVVDRIAAEAPGTLLLAEAFWMMEGYFVRSLGMHRVYNSAFMNMLKNEENEKYQTSLKNTLEFDPGILKRFVNFMNNPDEETAATQFGTGDKYFGICTMLATMPGLPMFGHGQIEGFHEKYGMEYRAARLSETPDEGLVDRHRKLIFPLLRRRALFTEVEKFTLYEFVTGTGVSQSVFAYSNRRDGEGALVIYNNSPDPVTGALRRSHPYREGGPSSPLRRRTIGEALEIPDNPRRWLIMRRHDQNLEFIHNCRELVRRGLAVELAGYECRVYLDLRVVTDDETGSYRQIAEKLNSSGAAAVENEIELLGMEPLHAAFARALDTSVIAVFREAIRHRRLPSQGFRAGWETEYRAFLNEAFPASEDSPPPGTPLLRLADSALHIATMDLPAGKQHEDKLAGYRGYLQRGLEMRVEAPAVLAAWCLTEDLNGGAETPSTRERSRSLIDQMQLARPLRAAFTVSGLSAEKADYAVTLVKLLTTEGDWFEGLVSTGANAFLTRQLHREEIQRFLLFNRYNSVLWFSKDRFEDLLWWFFCVAAIALANPAAEEVQPRLEELFLLVDRWLELEEQSGYRVSELVRLLAEKRTYD